ncbi:MFS transporter [Amycolatopsis acidiphila]|uniref:MFS transporter n=1 Tax=Amycolatopsis acidiphila TaxID=715473 RepID=A0A558AA86_9PSEU|nr:MFS transporter [Amycolatopsis acidiphila]TVT21154.1 MFS transporter [Amycolatopsis acidiphila]UIJ57241.1 MFS transporter [Amycolatopsis acidiphila]
MSQPLGPAAPSGRLTAVLAFAGVVVAVMQTLMVPLLAKLPELLRTSSSNTAWVITVTLLTGAVATPVLGRLGDMHGKRRMLLLALGLQVLGCLVCGLTSTLVPMMVGRGLQGFAIGAIPLGISIMRDELPGERLGSAVGLMSSSLGIGGALALPAAALVAEHLDWHVLFFGAGALGILSLALVLLVVPESAVRTPGRFDVRGAIGLSAGLVCLLVGISKGSDWGWGTARTLGFFGAAAVVFVGWGFLQLRTAEPLVDLRTTARRPVLLTNLASIMVGFALYATQLVPPQLLQLPAATGYGLGQSMIIAGLCVAPSGLLMMAVSPLGARLTAARGPKVSLLCGIVVLAVSYAAGLALLHEAWQLALFSAMAGIGVGLAYAAMPALIIDAVPASETAAANGLNTLMRSIGTSSSSAVVGMVLAHLTTDFRGTPVPALAGFRTAFLIGCGACVLALLVASFIPGRRTASPSRALRGTVRNTRGGVLAGALVIVTDARGDVTGSVTTGTDGAFDLAGLPPGRHVLTVAADGYRAAAAAAEVGDGATTGVDFALSPHFAVRGTVRAEDGSPLVDARVRLLGPEGTVVAVGTTGAYGDYLIDGLTGGSYTVIASGYPSMCTTVSLSGRGRDDFDLILSHPGH